MGLEKGLEKPPMLTEVFMMGNGSMIKSTETGNTNI